MASTEIAAKDKTKSRIRGLFNEAKVNAMFEALADQTLEDIVNIEYASRANAARVGRNLDEKKTLASMMPAEAKAQLSARFGIDIATDSARITIGEEIFSRLMKYLARHPERLTMGIYDTLIERNEFHYVVSLVQKKTMQDGSVNLIPTTTALTQKSAIDGEFMINMTNTLMAKISMIVESITKKDLKEANIGAKSKAFRDLLAGAHMIRLDFTPDQAMESTFKETSTSDDGKTVRESVVRYTKKSAETWASKK